MPSFPQFIDFGPLGKGKCGLKLESIIWAVLRNDLFDCCMATIIGTGFFSEVYPQIKKGDFHYFKSISTDTLTVATNMLNADISILN